MGKHKDSKKKKGSQFAIRVDKDERDAFVSLCEALDTSAAREIRRFMRDWVAANSPVAPRTQDVSPVSENKVSVAVEDTSSGAESAMSESNGANTKIEEPVAPTEDLNKPKKRKKPR